MYVRAGGDTAFDSFSVATVSELGSRAKYAESAASKDNELIDRLLVAKSDLRAQQDALEKGQKQAKHDLQEIESSKREVEAANQKQQALLSQVQGEIATLIQQEQARKAAEEKARSDAVLARMRAAAQAAAAQSATSTTGISSGSSTTSGVRLGVDPGNVAMPNVPAPSSGAAAAVAYAQAQLGKPYVYAATGPDAFDCSGLTMMAWAQGGVSMPHYSAAQGHMFPRVPTSAMEPGDLVIYYPDEHHVAIYVGGGMTIAATHTGDYVRLQPVFRDGFQYAVRPG
jgi:cell wall-associated NlpC family hydrolase